MRYPLVQEVEAKSLIQTIKNSAEYQAKVQKRKKAIKTGAVIAGTVLAAYGTYKLAKYVQDKRNTAAMKKASDYINQNFYYKQGHTKFADGSQRTYFENGRGDSITIGSRGSKALGQRNAKTVSTARQMYKDATNTRLDRGLAKVVNAGDSVGRGTKRAANATATAAKRAATTTKNKVLDVVNPIYEYTPSSTTTRQRTMKGFENLPIKETVATYDRIKKKRR